jgi:hypothetical protein
MSWNCCHVGRHAFLLVVLAAAVGCPPSGTIEKKVQDAGVDRPSPADDSTPQAKEPTRTITRSDPTEQDWQLIFDSMPESARKGRTPRDLARDAQFDRNFTEISCWTYVGGPYCFWITDEPEEGEKGNKAVTTTWPAGADKAEVGGKEGRILFWVLLVGPLPEPGQKAPPKEMQVGLSIIDKERVDGARTTRATGEALGQFRSQRGAWGWTRSMSERKVVSYDLQPGHSALLVTLGYESRGKLRLMAGLR